jgi:hypothetical protein
VRIFADVDPVGRENFCPILCCRWLAWIARSDTTIELQVPDNNCTDMTGAIQQAQKLNPIVVHIIVREAGSRQIINVYKRTVTSEGPTWKAIPPVQD